MLLLQIVIATGIVVGGLYAFIYVGTKTANGLDRLAGALRRYADRNNKDN